MKDRFFSILILLLLSLAFIPAQAQTEQEKLEALERDKSAGKQRLVTLQLDSAILLSHQGNYALAEKKFLFVLKNMRSIPTDLTYHFGLNSFFLAKYKQSIDWLNKYIQLKGTAGQYSEKAAEWMVQAQAALLQQQIAEKEKQNIVHSNDYDIDCGPSGRVVCPSCGGTTVVIKKSYINETYKTCPFCNKKGYLTCEEYNKIVRGELKPSNN